MESVREHETSLVDRFVASFEKLDEMTAIENLDPTAWELTTGDAHPQFGYKHWRPIRVETSAECLEPIYSKLPAHFPSLFERFVLSYRWAEVDLQLFTLLANPLGPDLSRFLAGMLKDGFLSTYLLRSGYVQFGKGPDMDYDPVCFDIGSRKKNGDCRVVKIDHQEILCNNHLKIVSELAPSFEQLVLQTIDQANKTTHT